jgi:hypothetical protein
MSKSREQWEAERDLAILRGQNRAVEWIDRKILYPIGNLINGKYPDDEKFKCSCGSHVAIRTKTEFGKIETCVVCGGSSTDLDTLKNIEKYAESMKV